MRILLIHQYFLHDHEGGGSRWNDMARAWVAAGHHVTVITGHAHYMKKGRMQHFSKMVNIHGVTVFRCGTSRLYHRGFAGRMLAYCSFALSVLRVMLFHAKGRYDLVLATSPPLSVVIPGMLISIFKRIPFVFEIRDLWPESAIALGVLRNRWLIRASYFLEKCALSRASLINVLTPAFRDALLAKGVPEAKIICIPNGADFELSASITASFDREQFRQDNHLNGKFVIVYAGAHGLANHLTQLVEAAVLLRDTPALFLLIGDGMEKAHLMHHCAQNNIQHVRFIPTIPRQEVIRYILAADLGAAVLKKSAVFETIYSNKTFDYLSCKKAVLVAIDGISRELIESAKAGIWAEPENAADIAAKVQYCMAQPQLLSEMGENGFHFARTHFDRQQLALEYLEALKGLGKAGAS